MTKMNKNLAMFLPIGKEIYFPFKAVLSDRIIDPDVKKLPLVQHLLKKLMFQGWTHLFLDTSLGIHKNKVVELYTNLFVLEESIVTSSIELVFDYIRLGEILQVPIVGLA